MVANTAAPRGKRTGGWTCRGGGRTGEPRSRVGGRTSNQGGQGGDRGIGGNGGDDEVPDFSMVIAQQLQDLLPTIIAQVGNHASNIQGDVRSPNMINGRNGCSYKEFMTRGREAVVGMTWEDFKDLIRKELCPNNEMQKMETEFWCHAMVGAGHVVYTDHFHELARLVPHLVTPKNKRNERYIYSLAPQIRAMVVAMKPTTIQSVVLKVGMLTDEAIRNGSLKKNTKNRGNSRMLSRKETAGPRMVTLVSAINPTTTQGACYECGGTDHYKASCPSNQTRRGAFMIGAEEARQDSNIVTGTFTLNNHYAKTLFDSGADYSFVSTTFIPLLDIGPSDLGFSYEIEIASGQLVKINKVIRDYKLETEGHTFDIDFIPFGHGSFDVIVGMDWLSRLKAEIVYHKKVVRIPLPHVRKFPKSPYRLAPSEMEELSSQLRELQDKGTKEEHEMHLGLILELLKKEKLYAKFSKYLPDGPEDFIVYYDASGLGLGGVLMQRDRNETAEVVNALVEMLCGLDKQMEHRSDEASYYLDQICVPLTGDIRTLIIDEAHKSKYSVHLGANKMYYDLRDRKFCSSILWAEVGEGQLIGSEIVQETTKKKGVLCFGKKGKLAPRFVGPFEITKRIGLVAYRLRLPEELNGVHDTFHVSNLNKCLANQTLHVPIEEIQVDAKLNFVEEPMEILEKEFKKLKRSRIPIIKVRWNSKRGPEFTWEREDQTKLKYSHLFSASDS
ncbi:putative reverse transcriptase domain-containing protein [Tanacetum coccineum]|uniref:Reverse transcriptase domain-containing protein n=1 Tax=Tanacetum coccineum TaxID=301880 RepID=A0ABQ5B5P5_9ASTR